MDFFTRHSMRSALSAFFTRHPGLALAAIAVLMIPTTGSFAFADGERRALQPVTNLAEDSQLASSENLVLVIEFSSEYCEYCELLEKEFLRPMMRNDDYARKVLIRTADIEAASRIVDFNGDTLFVEELAHRYDVSVTPTLVFLDPSGKPLSEPLVGIWSIDFFGGYIDQRIDNARSKLGATVD